MGGSPTGAGALVGAQLGKYELLALLALGGTAEIYLARIDGTAGFEKYVVVKCLHDHLADDQEFVSMFLDEARVGAQLDHSNIVQTLALGEQDGRYYLVMEFIAGLSLALVGRRASERVRGGKLPVPIVLNVAAQASAGLHYAHERVKNLVHRDISPQNLVITYEGIVKVVDFGIAKAEYRETRTRAGTVKGKFAYMSPEQCQAGVVDRRTDVFAMGVITWELLTGRRLFKRDSTYETYQAVVACDVPPPSAVNHQLDPALDALVMRALAKDPAGRYPTAEAFGEAMAGYLHHRGKASGPGEIARLFEESFSQELEEHYARMRELIEGRRKSVAEQKLLQWDSSELDGSASVMEVEELSGFLDESEAAPRVTAEQQQASAKVGPVSPPLASRAATAPDRARHPALEPAAPIDRPRVETLPVRKVALEPARAVAAEDDFEAGLETDAENELQGEATRIEDNPMASLAAMEAARRPAADPRRAATAPERPRPEPPKPRKAPTVLTPPGLRAGGAPLDPLPHERDAMLASATPPPTQVPPAPPVLPPLVAPPRPGAGRPAFREAPTVLAPDAAAAARPSRPPARFADAPTVHDARATPPGTPRFTDVATVHAEPAPAPPRARFVAAPTVVAMDQGAVEHHTGQTQMIDSDDLVEVGDARPAPAAPDVEPYMPAITPLPTPAQLMAMPDPNTMFPDQPYYAHLASGGDLRKVPPWLLAVMFVVVAAIATGITIAIARALQ